MKDIPQIPLIKAVMDGNEVNIKKILAKKPSKADKNNALKVAAKNGHLEIVKYLLPGTDADASTEALHQAAIEGHIEVVKALIPFSNSEEYSNTLAWVARNGHREVVKLLITLCDPKDFYSLALNWAATAGHLDVVEILAPLSPRDHRSKALESAVINRNEAVIHFLVPLCDVDSVIDQLIKQESFAQADILSAYFSQKHIDKTQSLDDLVRDKMPRLRAQLMEKTLKEGITSGGVSFSAR